MPAKTPAKSERGLTFGIQPKLLLLVAFFVFVFSATAGYGFYGFKRISRAFNGIVEAELPLVRSIREATVAMIEGKIALETILTIRDFSEIDTIRVQEAALSAALVRFDAFIAAITWGSDSSAFALSDGGLNLAEWRRLTRQEPLTVKRSDPQQSQRAAAADLYFGGFAHNATQAMAQYKRYLRLFQDGSITEAEEARRRALDHTVRALKFSHLASARLTEIAKASNQAITSRVAEIAVTETNVTRAIAITFASGFLVALGVGVMFARRSIVLPLKGLTAAAQRIGRGDLGFRAPVTSRDEIGVLAAVFNDMADRLTDYAGNLEAKVRERTQELNDIAKMLVRRDLELTRANLRLEELDRLKSEFVTVAAHQLRTPLAGIRWSLTALAENEAGDLTLEQAKLAQGALKVTLTMIDLINDLLNVARIEEGRFGFRLIRQPLGPVIAELVARSTKLAAEKGVGFTADLPKQNLPALTIDAEKITMALENLLDNAVKYTPPGGRVTLRVTREKRAVALEIADTGIGIPVSQRARLFQKFFRADNALLFQTAGTGLGLYVVKNIIDRHGGTVTIESEEGKGTKVTITLPIPK